MILPGDIVKGIDECHPRLWSSDSIIDWNDEWEIKLTSNDRILVISVGKPYLFVLVNGHLGYVNIGFIDKVQLSSDAS